MKVELNTQSPLNIDNAYVHLFKYFKKAKFDANTPLPELESSAREFLDNTKPEIKKSILESVYQPQSDLFQFSADADPYQRYSWLFGFQNFYRVVNNLLQDHIPVKLKGEGAKPEYVLKEDAFKYVGHNDTKGDKSNYSYASLFYH